jgi:hypothetical protein
MLFVRDTISELETRNLMYTVISHAENTDMQHSKYAYIVLEAQD